MSGLLTVWLQAMCPLNPRVGNGEPKKHAPSRFQPSSLTTCPSYHWPGPKNGWWGLMNMRALPDADLLRTDGPHVGARHAADMLCRSCSTAASSARSSSGKCDRARSCGREFPERPVGYPTARKPDLP